MTRRWFILTLLSTLIALSWGQFASATHPVIQRPYRFLPRFSTLTETGASATESVDFKVYGTFDLVIDTDHIDPWWGNTATFANVDAWASHPVLAYVLFLDDVLNLSGLKGEQLPVAGPFDAYRFTGFTQNGSSVDLFATLIGPWFHLTGGTTPPDPTSTARSINRYEINAIARTRPWADFNADGVVDNIDLALLRENYGSTDLGSHSISLGDADADGDVDGRDFLEWQRQSGETVPTALLEGGLSSVTSVPEPGTLWLMGVGIFFVILSCHEGVSPGRMKNVPPPSGGLRPIFVGAQRDFHPDEATPIWSRLFRGARR